MAVSIMDTTSSLSKTLHAQYPDITFVSGDAFHWSPTTAIITYNPDEKQAEALLLHELGHALLDHRRYQRDVELIGMETDAWEKARTLAPQYSIDLDDDHIESHLDTYRKWLHKRSTCPECNATGLQVGTTHYRCLACTHEWTVNEARICALRRYSIK